MNVQEAELQEKIDPFLIPEKLTPYLREKMGIKQEIKRISTLTGGCWNRLVALEQVGSGDDIVLKITPDLENSQLILEYDVLRFFTDRTSMPVPSPYFIDSSGNEIPGTVMAMERIPGHVLHQAYGFLNQENRELVTAAIAETVAKLHRLENAVFGSVVDSSLQVSSWDQFWLPRFDRIFDDVRISGVLDKRFIKRVRLVRPLFDEILSKVSKAVLTHYDIWAGNVMLQIDQSLPEITGYLDVGGFWADPVRELSFAELFGIADEKFYDIYNRYHEIDDEADIRKCIYNLKMTMLHVKMYPREDFYRNTAEYCLTTIERSL